MAKLKTIFWFLKRPRLYPELWHHLTESKKNRISPEEREESGAWCAQLAVDTATALAQLTGEPPSPLLKDLFPDVFARAERIARECPVKMGGPGDLNLLYALAVHCRAAHVVETGVAYGWSSLALLLALKDRPEARLVSTDMPYPDRNNDAYVGCVVPEPLRPQWQILRYADRQGLPKALKLLGRIDLCHYDSDKTRQGRLWAYPLLWDALRPGGYFISDDIGDNTAFRDFAAGIGSTPVIVGGAKRFVGIIRKPPA